MRLIYGLNLANMVSITLSQVVIVPILLNVLGVASYEHWLSLSATASICALSSLGIDVYGSNLARIAYAADDHGAAQRAIETTTTLLLLTLLLFLVAGAGFYAVSPSPDHAALGLMVVSAPLTIYRSYLSFIVTARTSQIGELITFIAFSLLQAAALALAAWLDGRIIVMAAAFTGSILLFGILPLILFIKLRTPDVRLRPVWLTVQTAANHYWAALPTFAYWAATITITHVPIIMLTTLPGIPTGSAATFAVSRTLVGVVRQFCVQLARSNGIELSRYLAPHHAQQLRQMLMAGSAVTTILAAVGLGALLPMADLVIALWTRQTNLYDPAVVAIFCLGGVFSALVQVPMILPQFTNRAHIMLRPLAVQILLVLGLGSLGAMVFHAAGMVAALTVAELSTLGLVSMRRIIPELGIDPIRFLLATGGPAAAMMVVSAAGSQIARSLIMPETMIGLVYCGLLWTIMVPPIGYGVFRWIKMRQSHLITDSL